MDQIFNANNSMLPKSLFNNRVVCQSNSLFVNFPVSPLVDQFSDTLQIRITISNIRLYSL
uniref:Uncharacterized protein n=1 Tax=Lotus japonicus TaxID=34305 RepID=I3SSG5_LOTJA|nr:unknown [Lotus japonicus]